MPSFSKKTKTMARYTQHFTITVSPESLHSAILESFNSCELPIVYSTGDYILAQESAGKVSYGKLVTVEILIHQTAFTAIANKDQVRLTCVTKNGELPLRQSNHCRTMADLVNKAFENNPHWLMLESIAG
jgi:hypothetical protein